MARRSFFGFFSKDPFIALQNLSVKVKECAAEVQPLFDAFFEGDYEQVRARSERISHLEHEADIVKNRARDTLPRAVFMPVDRRDYLDVLTALDAIADCAEDVGILFTLRRMEAHEELIEPLKSLVRRVLATSERACELVMQTEELMAANFSGPEAQSFLDGIDELGRLEHEADIVQDDLARRLFAMEDDIKPASLLVWNKIFNKVGDMANNAERMGNRMRLFVSL